MRSVGTILIVFASLYSVPPDSPADPVWEASGPSTRVWFPRVLLGATGGGPIPASGEVTALGQRDSTGETIGSKCHEDTVTASLLYKSDCGHIIPFSFSDQM